MNTYSNKTVLITGATGFIGNNLVDTFMKMGDVRVIALSRTMQKLKAEFAEYENSHNFKMIEQDISSPLIIEEPVDFIFHAAGSMEGKVIKNYPVDVIKSNILGTMNCLSFLQKQKELTGKSGRMILFSSITVYANNTDEELVVNETNTGITDTLESARAPYSQSKRMIEVIATAYAKQYGVDSVICRFSTVYGPTRIPPDTAFFEFIRKGISGENIILNSANLPKRDNIYIDDAINGAIIVGAKGATGEAYNVSSNGDMGNYASVEEIAQAVAGNSDKGIKVYCKNEVAGNCKPGIRLSNEKIRKLGWRVTVSLENGIKQTLSIMKKNDEYKAYSHRYQHRS